MENGGLKEWSKAIRDQFQAHRHSALLAAIITSYAVRPLLGGGAIAGIIFNAALLLLLLIALHNINIDELIGEREKLLKQSRRRGRIGWALVAAAFVERVALIVFGHNRTIDAVGSVAWFLLLAFVTWSTLRGLLKQKAITSETISMSISVYLLIGFTWGLLYDVIFMLQPQAFSIAGYIAPARGQLPDPQPMLPILSYFSLITLSTVGYGDITPLTLQARFAAAAEGITGQFYLAILVARLVGMQMSQGSNQAPTQTTDPAPDDPRKD